MNSKSALVDNSGEMSWSLQLGLQAPRLKVLALQWAILSDDPTTSFRADLARMARLFEKRQAEHADAIGTKTYLPQLAITWDHLFAAVPGDCVFLLTSAPNAHLLKADGMAGKKWVVTKAIRKDANAYCWCIPFVATVGQERSITLDDENVVNLADLAEDRG